MNKRILLATIAVAACTLTVAACSKHHSMKNRNMTPAQASALQAASARRAARTSAVMPSTAATTGAAKAATVTLPHLAYIAKLYPLNGSVLRNRPNGRVQFGINDGKLTIRVDVAGVPPNMAHAQHIHGFVSGKASSCPSSTADVNGDGIVSLSEAEAVQGPPVVPLNGNPATMDFTSLTYPKASANGTYTYKKTMSLSALQKAYAKAHNGKNLDFANDTVTIHGVPESMKSRASSTAPGTMAAGMAASASATAAMGASATTPTAAGRPAISQPASLPIACGKITAVNQSH